MFGLNRKPQESDDQSTQLARKWHKRIRAEKKAHEDWRKEAKDAWDVYLKDSEEHDTDYPLLWSVTDIQLSAIYSSRPVPIVKPRNQERVPAHKTAASVMERGLECVIDQAESDSSIDRAIVDYLLAALGTVRVKLDADIEEVPVTGMDGQPVVDLEGKPLTEPVIKSQDLWHEYVPWSRFGWEPAACWDHVGWIYYRHPMKKAEIIKRYGEDASFGASEDEYSSEDRKCTDSQPDYWVYEIWDKENRQVIHLAEGGQEALAEIDDPLKISGFWPCPQPLMTNLRYDALTPKTDYSQIESFDDDLQRLFKRARSLVEQIKAVTFHDDSIVELEDFSEIEDGTSVAIKNVLERFGPNGDLNSLIVPWPIKEKVEALQHVMQQIDAKRQQVDQLLGISDILRGASNPQEGQETQKIKERWGGIRLRRKQIAIQRYIRDLYRITGEVMVEQFTRENLQRMTQVQIDDATWQILQNDFSREFAIDIETDSTIAKDEFEDKQARTELMNAIGQWVQQVAMPANQGAIPGDLSKELLSLTVAPYGDKARGLDQVIEQLTSTQRQISQIPQLQQQIQQLQQQLGQRDYALSQYSQAEEQRKNQESMAKVQKDQATAAKTQAGTQDEQAQTGETVASTELKKAQAFKTMVEANRPPEIPHELP